MAADRLLGVDTAHAWAPEASADALVRWCVEDSCLREDTARGMAHGGQLGRVAGEDTRHHLIGGAGHATPPGDRQDQHCATLATVAVDSVAELLDRLVLPRV